MQNSDEAQKFLAAYQLMGNDRKLIAEMHYRGMPCTPFQLGVLLGFDSIVKELIQQGADVNEVVGFSAQEDFIPICPLTREDDYSKRKPPLHLATGNPEHKQVLETLLACPTLDIEQMDDAHQTALAHYKHAHCDFHPNKYFKPMDLLASVPVDSHPPDYIQQIQEQFFALYQAHKAQLKDNVFGCLDQYIQPNALTSLILDYTDPVHDFYCTDKGMIFLENHLDIPLKSPLMFSTPKPTLMGSKRKQTNEETENRVKKKLKF